MNIIRLKRSHKNYRSQLFVGLKIVFALIFIYLSPLLMAASYPNVGKMHSNGMKTNFNSVNTMMQRTSRSTTNYQQGYNASVMAISSASASSASNKIYSTSKSEVKSYNSAGSYNYNSNYKHTRSAVNNYSAPAYSYSLPSYSNRSSASTTSHSDNTVASAISLRSGSASISAVIAQDAVSTLAASSAKAAGYAVLSDLHPAIRRTISYTTEDDPLAHENGEQTTGGYYYWDADRGVWYINDTKESDIPEPLPIGNMPWLMLSLLCCLYAARKRKA